MPPDPFREFLRSLPGDIELARDAGLPIVLDVTQPLHPASQRLMDTLGVEVRVVTQHAVRARSMGGYAEDGATRQPFEPNLIDFRHSVVQANKRADAGDETLEICAYCMCEVDVHPQPHRPDCPGIGKSRASSGPVLAGLEVARSPRARPPVVAGAAVNEAPEPDVTEERFWTKVDRRSESECWEWLGAKSDGYGRLKVDGRACRAHRFAYELLVGPIPDEMTLDHLCRNRACVNPAHLEIVTNKDNVLRGEGVTAENAIKTHCVHGHEFTDENTYVIKTGPKAGGRECRTCHRERKRDADAADQIEGREPQVPVEPTSAPPAIEPPAAPSRSSSTNPYGLKKFGRGYTWTEAAVLAAVRTFVAEHDRPPVPMDGLEQPHGHFPSAKSVSNLFATWDEMIVAAGFTPAARGMSREGLPSARWTRESAVEAIQAYVAEHGAPPAQDKIVGTGLPGKKPAKRLFGGWLKMLEAAGVEVTVAMVRGEHHGGRVNEDATSEERGRAALPQAQPARSSNVDEARALAERVAERLGPVEARSAGARDLTTVRAAALAAVNAIFDLLDQLEQAL